MTAKRAHFLRTPRLGFGQWSDDDLPLALALWGDPAVTGYTAIGGVMSEEQSRERLEREIGTQREVGVQYWPVFRLEDGAFIGCCGLKPRPEKGVFEIGFQICSRFWGLGYATEAARAAAAYAFERLGGTALFAGHHPENAASRRVLAKLGFRYTHVEHFEGTGLSHVSYRLEPGELLY
jgi:RimJ/RimL family protein N-acetyltransferase